MKKLLIVFLCLFFLCGCGEAEPEGEEINAALLVDNYTNFESSSSLSWTLGEDSENYTRTVKVDGNDVYLLHNEQETYYFSTNNTKYCGYLENDEWKVEINIDGIANLFPFNNLNIEDFEFIDNRFKLKKGKIEDYIISTFNISSSYSVSINTINDDFEYSFKIEDKKISDFRIYINQVIDIQSYSYDARYDFSAKYENFDTTIVSLPSNLVNLAKVDSDILGANGVLNAAKRHIIYLNSLDSSVDSTNTANMIIDGYMGTSLFEHELSFQLVGDNIVVIYVNEDDIANEHIKYNTTYVKYNGEKFIAE